MPKLGCCTKGGKKIKINWTSPNTRLGVPPGTVTKTKDRYKPEILQQIVGTLCHAL